MKIKYALLLAPLVTGLAACNDDDKEVVIPTPELTDMKVMSFNIRYVNTIDLGDNAWDARRQPCIDLILDQAPDIVGLQEAHEPQRDDLVEGLGHKYALFSAVDDGVADNRTGHTAILYDKSRFTVLDQGHFWLSPTPDVESKPAWNATDTQYRTTIWLYLHDNVSGKDLYFYDTHLPYKSEDKEARNECVKLNIERMKEKAGRQYPVIITGDMNASYHTTDGRRQCLSYYYAWMWAGRDEAVNLTPDVMSFNNFGATTPAVTWNLDHIFYRKFEPCEFAVVDSPNYGVEYVSDHYPITLTLKY